MKEFATESATDVPSEEFGGDVASVNSDDALLMAMGKAPELKRVYNFWTVRKLCFGI
jgi:hypothetical protein